MHLKDKRFKTGYISKGSQQTNINAVASSDDHFLIPLLTSYLYIGTWESGIVSITNPYENIVQGHVVVINLRDI